MSHYFTVLAYLIISKPLLNLLFFLSFEMLKEVKQIFRRFVLGIYEFFREKKALSKWHSSIQNSESLKLELQAKFRVFIKVEFWYFVEI